jgi:heme/copper-type cytochrome/quinol oxidase subunit 2
MRPTKPHLFLTLLAVEGAAALAVYFRARSEAGNAQLWGFSYARLAVGLGVLTAVVGLLVLAIWASRRPEQVRRSLARYEAWASTPARVWGVPAALFFTTLFLVGAYFFTYLFLPGHLRPVLAWMADNVVARVDAAGNIKPDKEKSA